MLANTEPVFIRNVYTKLVRVQVGVVVATNVGQTLTGIGSTLVSTQELDQGALLTDLWCQPLGTIGAGFFLRLFLSDFGAQSVNLLSEVAITATGAAPLLRQELGSLLPELLMPSQSSAGKKRGLYIAAGNMLTIGLSADLPAPLVVGCQGGFY